MSARMYMQSFVALSCVLRKTLGIFGPLENWFQEQGEEEGLEWLSGTRLPGPNTHKPQTISCLRQMTVAVLKTQCINPETIHCQKPCKKISCPYWCRQTKCICTWRHRKKSAGLSWDQRLTRLVATRWFRSAHPRTLPVHHRRCPTYRPLPGIEEIPRTVT